VKSVDLTHSGHDVWRAVHLMTMVFHSVGQACRATIGLLRDYSVPVTWVVFFAWNLFGLISDLDFVAVMPGIQGSRARRECGCKRLIVVVIAHFENNANSAVTPICRQSNRAGPSAVRLNQPFSTVMPGLQRASIRQIVSVEKCCHVFGLRITGMAHRAAAPIIRKSK